jgi:hypothetical protein
MSLVGWIASYLTEVQEQLFPFLRETIGPLTEKDEHLTIVLGMIRVENFVFHWRGLPGRPLTERAALARSFIAKAVHNYPTTRMLIDALRTRPMLKHLCGWTGGIPSEATFSRAFAEFAASDLPTRLHTALIEAAHEDRLVGHVARDSTAIEVPEKPQKPEPPAAAEPKSKRKRGRPRKGEEPPPKEPRRIERQAAGMSLEAMLADLPSHCDVGTKQNAKGHRHSWIGYKLHIDTVDGDIPVACILTAASVHDSQVAIPLATMTAGRVVSCYDLMDSAYDVPEILSHSQELGHVPIIDVNPRRDAARKNDMTRENKAQKAAGYRLAEDIRFGQRSSAERVNGNLKENYGGSTVRVRGAAKVACHLMFGILVIAALQIVRLVT